MDVAVKSVEIFCRPSDLPPDLFQLVWSWVNPNQTTIRVRAGRNQLEVIRTMCSEYQIHCQFDMV
jgi:hypothetical protein